MVSKQSNILCLFKQFNKPLALKQAKQEAEEKQLESLFDDCIPTNTSTEDKTNEISNQT